jgi:hypothetical protein
MRYSHPILCCTTCSTSSATTTTAATLPQNCKCENVSMIWVTPSLTFVTTSRIDGRVHRTQRVAAITTTVQISHDVTGWSHQADGWQHNTTMCQSTGLVDSLDHRACRHVAIACPYNSSLSHGKYSRDADGIVVRVDDLMLVVSKERESRRWSITSLAMDTSFVFIHIVATVESHLFTKPPCKLTIELVTVSQTCGLMREGSHRSADFILSRSG